MQSYGSSGLGLLMPMQLFKRQAAAFLEMASTTDDVEDKARFMRTAHIFEQLADEEKGSSLKSLHDKQRSDPRLTRE